MARYPSLSSAAASIGESFFGRMAARLASCKVDVFPFHLGEQWMAPPPAARLSSLPDLDDPALYRYGSPAGDPALVAALAAKCRRHDGLSWVEPAAVVVTCGATLGLAAALRALLDPGDELLLCAPYWPQMHSIATSAGIVPVEVDVSQRLYADPHFDVHAALSARTTERTRAVYFASPNNPDGKVLPRAALEALARFARERDLWVIADEVYEDMVFGAERLSIAALEGMAARTVTAYSLSKSYALAGLRVGYVVADPKVIHALRKLVSNSVLNVPLAAQRAALAAVEGGASFLAAAGAEYRAARDLASRAVPLPHFLPDGGAYIFFDLGERAPPGEDGITRFHDRLLDHGIALSPGAQFGTSYARFARLCYTVLPPDHLARGLARFADLVSGA